MVLKRKKIFNLIVITILMILFLNMLSLSNYNDIGKVYAETPGDTTGVSGAATGQNTKKGFMLLLKEAVAQWYYIFRYFSIIVMLVVLIYLGIQLAINSVASDKAKYKRMLADWCIGFVMIFGIHYFMVLVINLNEVCLNTIKNISDNVLENIATKIAADGGGSVNMVSLYETIRTRAYEFRVGIGTAGMIMYMVLVYYTIRFVIIYFKRLFTIMILTITAPLVGLSYAFTKVMTGKAPILSKWGGEYCFNVFLQSIHALIYTVFVAMALALSTESIAGFILALIMLNFMLKADKIFRKIFKISGGLLDENADKDIKENLATLTAMKASMGNVLNSDMTKGAVSTVKRGVGAVANVGMVAGFKASNQILKSNDSKLYDKKLESEQMQAEISSGKLSKEEEDNIKKQKAKLDDQIIRMETRRKKMKKYTEPVQSDSATGQYIDEKTKSRREARIEAEYKARIEKRKNMGLAALSEEKAKQLRKQVEREIDNQVKRRNVYKDERTGKKEVTDGVAYQLSQELNRAIFGNDAIKGATKKMVGDTANRIAGQAMIFAAIPLTVANPKVGLAMLGKGMKKAKSTNEFRKATNYNQRRTLIKGNRKKPKQPKKKYSFNRFTPGTIKALKAKDKRNSAASMIKNINNPSISLAVFTLPFKLTGMAGSARIISQNLYKIQSTKKKYYEAQEASYAVARKDSINDDYISLYRNTVKGICDKCDSMSEDELILEAKQITGTIFDINGNKLEFANTNISSLTKENLIDDAILSIAISNNITDLNDLNLSNKFIQTQLISKLADSGILRGKENLSAYEPSKELTTLFNNLEERKKKLSNTNLAREKLVQVVTTQYMQEHKISNPEELKTEEHAEKIKEIVFERIQEGKIKAEEAKMQSQVEEIIKKAYSSSSDQREKDTQIGSEINELFIQGEKEDTKELVQSVTETYMQEHGINDPEELKTGEHAEKIAEILVEKIKEEKVQTQEDTVESQVEEIIKKVYSSTTDEEERKTQIEEEIKQIFKKQEEDKKDTGLDSTLEELFKRKNVGTQEEITGEIIETEIINEEDTLETTQEFKENTNVEDVLELINANKGEEPQAGEREDKYFDVITQEIVEEKTQIFIENLNVEDVLASIEQKRVEQEETTRVIEDVLSSVKEVEEKPTLNTEERKIVKSPTTSILTEIVAKKKEEEIEQLNEELEIFDTVKSVDEITDEFIEKNSSGKYDYLIGHLIASMKEDRVLVDLKIKKPDDKRKLAMEYSDERKAQSTYQMSIEDIIKSVSVK